MTPYSCYSLMRVWLPWGPVNRGIENSNVPLQLPPAAWASIMGVGAAAAVYHTFRCARLGVSGSVLLAAVASWGLAAALLSYTELPDAMVTHAQRTHNNNNPLTSLQHQSMLNSSRISHSPYLTLQPQDAPSLSVPESH